MKKYKIKVAKDVMKMDWDTLRHLEGEDYADAVVLVGELDRNNMDFDDVIDGVRGGGYTKLSLIEFLLKQDVIKLV